MNYMFPEPVFSGPSAVDGVSKMHWELNDDFLGTAPYNLRIYAGAINSATYVELSSDRTRVLSGDFVIPQSWLSVLPNSVSGYFGISLKSADDELGYQWYVTVPTSVVPTFAALTLAKADTVIPSGWGVWVQSKSKVLATITGAAGAYGSTIKSYSIVFKSQSGTYSGAVSSLTTGTLNNAGTGTFTAIITDSRGRTTAKSVSIAVVAYANPSISSFIAQRCTSAGVLADEGTYARISAVDVASSVSGKNVISRALKYRRVGDTAWTSAGIYSNGLVVGTGLFLIGQAYEFMATLTDSFGNVTSSSIIAIAFDTLDFRVGGRGVAIGKVSEKDKFEVAMDAEFTGAVSMASLAVAGAVDMSSLSVTGVVSMPNTLQAGTLTVASQAANSSSNYTVNFSTHFPVVPVVVCSVRTSSPQSYVASIYGISTTQVTITFRNNTASVAGGVVGWIATVPT